MSEKTRMQQRANDLDEMLTISYEKLGEFQKELVISSNVSIKFELKKKIVGDIIPQIKAYEAEYANLLANELNVMDFSDENAEKILIEIQDAITLLKETAEEMHSEVLMKSVEKAQEALEKPTTAIGKLRAVIPIIPGIISYQLELDVYSTLTGLWEKLKRSF
ncbi:MAG: hypothetical protein RLZ75_2021 [Pseudomonadota bacterium]|jgi:hypothetical protein